MKLILVACSILIFTGCVPSYNLTNYIPPKLEKTQNRIVHSQNFETTWKTLLKSVSETFFSINSIDKENGFISVNYSGDPERYLSAGTIEIKSRMGALIQDYSIQGNKSNFEYDYYKDLKIIQRTRTVKLNGVINILAVEDSSKTILSVTAKYIVTIEYRDYNHFTKFRTLEHSETFSFDTNGKATDQEGIEYFPSGELENIILKNFK